MIWVWSINETNVFIMEFKVLCPLLSEIAALSVFYSDQNKESTLKKFEQLKSTCNFGENSSQLWSMDKMEYFVYGSRKPHFRILKVTNLPRNAKNHGESSKMNSTKPNYHDFFRDWAKVIFEWFVINYFRYYGHF